MKKKIIPLIIVLLTLLVLFLVLLFTGVFNTYNKYQDLKYGENERNTLDLYIPKNYKGTGLLLYIHGGAWIAGSKDGYKRDLEKYAKKGIACAAINYRYTSSDVTCNDILDDIDSAVSFIKEKANSYGYTLDKMMLTGHSAGAHLSLLYSYKYQDTSVIKPVAVASFAGPTDLTDSAYYENWDSAYELFSYMIGLSFNSETIDLYKDDLLDISPISYVNSKTIPTIIAQGEKDDIVSLYNGKILENVLKENNVTYYAYYYPNSGHGLDNDKDISKIVNNKFDEFINTYLK